MEGGELAYSVFVSWLDIVDVVNVVDVVDMVDIVLYSGDQGLLLACPTDWSSCTRGIGHLATSCAACVMAYSLRRSEEIEFMTPD
jgi:hypothetical protein